MFHLFSSGYSDQLLTFSMNDVTGKLNLIGQTKIGENASFGLVDNNDNNGANSLYLVHETDNYNNQFENSGAISRWKFTDDSDNFVDSNETVTSRGRAACHIDILFQFGLLLVSNYHGRSFASYSFDKDTGSIKNLIYDEEYKDQGSRVNPERQDTSHPHGAYHYKNFVYVCDLGADKIWQYSVSANPDTQQPKIEKNRFTQLSNGSGPRHMAFDEESGRAFLVTELDSKLIAFKVDEVTGDLIVIETLDLYSESFRSEIAKNPEEVQYPAEIALHPNRKWLYVSNRGLGAIFQFDISAEDGIKRGSSILTPGNWPRHFSIRPDGKFMVVAQQLTNTLEVYSIDPIDGHLAETDRIASDNSPAFVDFYRWPRS